MILLMNFAFNLWFKVNQPPKDYEESFEENSYSPELLNRSNTPGKRPRQDRPISYSQALKLVRSVRNSLTAEVQNLKQEYEREIEEMRALVK